MIIRSYHARGELLKRISDWVIAQSPKCWDCKLQSQVYVHKKWRAALRSSTLYVHETPDLFQEILPFSGRASEMNYCLSSGPVQENGGTANCSPKCVSETSGGRHSESEPSADMILDCFISGLLWKSSSCRFGWHSTAGPTFFQLAVRFFIHSIFLTRIYKWCKPHFFS